MLRISAVICVTFLLSGCNKKTTFEDNYTKTDITLKNEMKAFDKDLDSALKKEPGEEPVGDQKYTQH